MADLLPRQFKKSAPPAFTIGFTDFLTNRAYLTMFAGKTANGYVLSSISYYSNDDEAATQGGSGGTNDIDFDAIAEVPLILEGTAIVWIPLCHASNGSGGGDVNTTITVRIRKWDGTTETTLVSQTVTANQVTSTGSRPCFLYSASLTIPRETFVPNDVIRLTIETTAPTGNQEILVIHDPKGRDWNGSTSIGDSGAVTQPDTTALTALLPVVVR